MTAMETLTKQVAANTSIEESAVTLIQGIAAQLAAMVAQGDPAVLQAQAQLLSDSLAKSAADLAAAVSANTPAVVPAPAEPPVA